MEGRSRAFDEERVLIAPIENDERIPGVPGFGGPALAVGAAVCGRLSGASSRLCMVSRKGGCTGGDGAPRSAWGVVVGRGARWVAVGAAGARRRESIPVVVIGRTVWVNPIAVLVHAVATAFRRPRKDRRVRVVTVL